MFKRMKSKWIAKASACSVTADACMGIKI